MYTEPKGCCYCKYCPCLIKFFDRHIRPRKKISEKISEKAA